MNPTIKILQLILIYSVLKSTIAKLKNSHKGRPICMKDLLNSQALFLTPYIENGDIETGRSLSRVGQLPNAPSVPSYSGFFTVNKEYNSNIFFWFFPALNKDVHAPIILWLEGGPGISDVFSIFVVNGPYVINSNMTSGLREHAWAKEFNVLYVDNPVGTGFSFTDNDKGYATNQDEVTEDLYEFLKQFFEVYYEYRHNDFYICGQSYGGKHTVHLGYKLHVDGPPAEVKFKGITVGNGVIDAHIYKNYDDYLYELGLVDHKQTFIVEGIYDSMDQHLQKGENLLALKEYNKLFMYSHDPDLATPSNLSVITGYEFLHNILVTKRPEDYSYYLSYVESQQFKAAIHVGNLPYKGVQGQDTVQHFLNTDIILSSSILEIGFLANNYKVLLYNGQLDLDVPYVATEDVLLNLSWKHSEDYRAAQRKIWRLDNDVAGYVRNFGNLYGILVRNAGHLVPHDQPKVALQLITRFIKDVPYT